MKSPLSVRNTVWNGFALGLAVPVVTYGVLLGMYTLMDSAGIFSDVGFADDFRTRTLGLMAICANLFVIQFRRRAYEHEMVRGILMATMLLVILWFWKYGFNILRG